MALKFNGRLARARQLIAGGNAATETDVLRAGELGFVTDTGDLRVGDGSTAFSALKSVRNHRRIRTVTATGNIGIDDEIIIGNAAGAITLTLPSAVTNSGRIFAIRNRSAGGAITLASAAGNVDGGANISIATTSGIARVGSDGTNWYTV